MRKIFCLVITAVLVALPLSAAQNIIYRGVDLWNTTDDGSTHVDFAKKPIPAGFFCSTSLPFTGRVEFRGVPIATGVVRELGTTDTIVERLDDAVFNKRGVATTRIRFRALQMESIAPIETACGSFNVKVQLAEVEQPVTRMRIVRENKDGGRFLAPIALHSKLIFTPIAGSAGERRELLYTVNYAGNPNIPWQFRAGTQALEKRGPILVDSNFDGQPDSFVTGTSNFAAGWSRAGGRLKAESECHVPPECGHCVEPVLSNQ
jgi:hypothetical protein